MHYTISDFLLDIIQNSIEAGGKEIDTVLDETGTTLSVLIRDDGCGMTAAQIQRALDPFHTDGIKHPGRKVGLGLPFLHQAVTGLDGTMDIESAPGKGTTIRFSLPLDNIDTPPLGDLSACFVSAMTFSGDYEFRGERIRNGEAYSFSRKELTEALGDLDSVGSITLLREYLESLEDSHGENNT